MNNKIVFGFIMCFILSMSASEADDACYPFATVSNKNKGDVLIYRGTYQIKDIRKIDLCNREPNAEEIKKELSLCESINKDLSAFYHPSEKVRQSVSIAEVVFYEDEKHVIFTGMSSYSNTMTEKYEISIQKSDWEDVKEKLKMENTKPFKDESGNKRFFHISLVNVIETEHIRLQLTKEQGEQLSKDKRSYKFHILGFGSAIGLVCFLIYYFDLYSKGMTLLGRN